MKVKVVCACSVSLGCLFFHQQGEKVDFSLQRDVLFGKSRLVSFNEVSKGPDDFSTSGLFFVLCMSVEVKTQRYFLLCGTVEQHAHKFVPITHSSGKDTPKTPITLCELNASV